MQKSRESKAPFHAIFFLPSNRFSNPIALFLNLSIAMQPIALIAVIAVAFTSTSHALPHPFFAAIAQNVHNHHLIVEWTAKLGCKEVEGQQLCKDIAGPIVSTPDGISQANVQLAFCKWGYDNCDVAASVDGCNNAYSRCMTGDYGCNAWGSGPAPPAGPGGPDPGTNFDFCNGDTDGIGCDGVKGMIGTNEATRSIATIQLPFCRAAYTNCKASGMGDCVNSLSRCLSGSWNCNGHKGKKP
jgi:hypothetical protein